jgi:hypothetical protein
MVSAFSALLYAINTMKNTIDDPEYIVDKIDLYLINQCVKNSCHSHSIVNRSFLRININGLLVVLGSNTMKNTMFRNSCIRIAQDHGQVEVAEK